MPDETWFDVIESGFMEGFQGEHSATWNPYPKMTEEWDCWNRWYAIGVEASKE